jgi:hypothetical protein
MMKQDTQLISDLPRLAAPEAKHFGNFPKLRSVRIEDGAICGELPETTDADGYWDPFEAWYRGAEPYLHFAKCGDDDVSVKRFVERCGIFGQNLVSDHRKSVFRLADFKRERWLFAFWLHLCNLCRESPNRPAVLRQFLMKTVQEVANRVDRIAVARQKKPAPAFRMGCEEREGSWRSVIGAIAHAAGLSILDDDGNPRNSESKAIYNKLETCDDRTLVATAHHLLSQAFWGKLQSARPRLDFPRNEKPRLVVECRDLLVSFYWMLATDLDKGRAPMVCAHCKKFFSSARKGATYCEKQACRERGRRQLDWDRNRDKYNRNRRLKRRKAKQQRQTSGRKGRQKLRSNTA